MSLKDGFSVSTEEIAKDVTVNLDADGNIISIDVEYASYKLALKALEMKDFPGVLVKAI